MSVMNLAASLLPGFTLNCHRYSLHRYMINLIFLASPHRVKSFVDGSPVAQRLSEMFYAKQLH
jgi:hypothetical protein